MVRDNGFHITPITMAMSTSICSDENTVIFHVIAGSIVSIAESVGEMGTVVLDEPSGTLFQANVNVSSLAPGRRYSQFGAPHRLDT